MRWLGIIALSLLALVPPCSSYGNHSITSVFPSVIPSVSNETDDVRSTLLNSTDITQADTEASPTASTVYPPLDNLTAVNRGLEEGTIPEQGNEIEYSSTDYTLELTPTREDDEEGKNDEEVKNDEAASSQLDNVQAEPSRSRDIESQPQSAESPPAQATNSSDLDKYSADELEIKLNEAKAALDGAKNATESVKKARDSKQEELNKANADYEEKKKIWENLDNIAKAKAEIWTEAERNATNANSEYDTAKTSFNNAEQSLLYEQGVLDEFPAKIEKANEKVEIIKKRPETLIELKLKRTDKINGKPQLQPTINRLFSEATKKKGEWETASNRFKAAKEKYDLDNCNDPTKALPSCPATAASKAQFEPFVGLAKEAYEEAKKAEEAARKELANYHKDLSTIEDRIEDLETNSIEPTLGDDIAAAEREVAALVRKEGSQTKKVENWKGLKQKAEEEQELKRVANETAYEKVKNGRPPEIDTANNEASNAYLAVTSANNTRIKVDEEFKKLETDLNSAKATETKLESEVGNLEKAYAEARKKEEVKTGSSPLLGVGLGLGGLLLLIGVGLAIFFWCRHKKKKGNGPNDKKNTKKGAANSRTPSTSKGPEGQPLTSSTQKTSATPAGSAAVPASPAAPTAAAPAGVTTQSPAGTHVPDLAPAQVDGFSTPQIVDKSKIFKEPKKGKEVYGISADRPIPDYNDVPFEEGEAPFKVDAKNFKWRGPLVSKSRHHGAPVHLLEGKKGPEKLDKIWFDPDANFATEIGKTEIMEDGGPASDSSRSEYLDYQDEWEKAREAKLAADAAEAIPNPTRSQKEDSKEKRRLYRKAARECAKKQQVHSHQNRKKLGKDKKSKRKSTGSRIARSP